MNEEQELKARLKENGNELMNSITKLLLSLTLAAVAIFYSSYVIAYGWNTHVINLISTHTITLWQAFALNTFVGIFLFQLRFDTRKPTDAGNTILKQWIVYFMGYGFAHLFLWIAS